MSDSSAVVSLSSILDSLPDTMKLDLETVAFVVILVTCLFLFMKYVCFQPIIKLIDDRDKIIRDGSAKLAEANLLVEERQIEYTMRLREAKSVASEYYKKLSEKALNVRQELIGQAHQDANKELMLATMELDKLQQEVKKELISKIEDLSLIAMQRITGRV